MADMKEIMAVLMESDFTPTVHKSVYPGIAPSRPELSQAGRSILITGGGTSIGKSIAEHFILANAANVIIVGRRQEVLDTATAELEVIAKKQSKPAKILAIQADVSKKEAILELFSTLASKGLALDVLVLNAAMFSGLEGFLDLGADKVREPMETNVKGPMYMTEAFMKQNEDKQKFLVNLGTGAMHILQNQVLPPPAPYALSKLAGTLFVQMLANQIPIEKLQVVSYHPGSVWNPSWPLPEEAGDWDQANLGGAFAVWAASGEAAFVHGRFVWASWDVEELKKGDVRERIEADYDYLRIGVTGFKDSKRAAAYT